MIEPTCSQRDAASVLFNLSGYRVVKAVDSPLGIRKVVVEALDLEGGCPSCGVLTAQVHQRTLQRVRDVPDSCGAESDIGQRPLMLDMWACVLVW